MKTTEVLIAALLAAGFTSAAKAVPIQLEDTYLPSPGVELTGNHAAWVFQHQLTGTGDGYDAATDTLSRATITLWFSGLDDQWDKGRFDLNLGTLTAIGGGRFDGQVTASNFDIGMISSSGILDVMITRTNAAGSVRLDKSVLTVLGERGGAAAVAVPEPGTMSLLGIGLLTIGYSRRRSGLSKASRGALRRNSPIRIAA